MVRCLCLLYPYLVSLVLKVVPTMLARDKHECGCVARVLHMYCAACTAGLGSWLVWDLAFMVLPECGYSITTGVKVATLRRPLLSSFALGSIEV
jgi:hypothetical protein